MKSVISTKEPSLPVVETGVLEYEHLAKLLGIDKELTLSIYLDLTSPTGMTLLLQDPFIIDKYTRYFSYSCRTKRTYVDKNYNTIKSNSDRKLIFNTDATHLVVGV